jgi:hypothetical protein
VADKIMERKQRVRDHGFVYDPKMRTRSQVETNKHK